MIGHKYSKRVSYSDDLKDLAYFFAHYQLNKFAVGVDIKLESQFHEDVNAQIGNKSTHCQDY